MTKARELFQAKITQLLERVPTDQQSVAAREVEAVLASAPSGDAKTIGAFVGPRLRELEKQFTTAVPSLSKEAKLRALLDCGALTISRHDELLCLLGQPGVGKAIEGAYGQLTGKRSDAPIVTAYGMIEGFMFERSRARIAHALGYTGTQRHERKVAVAFTGVRDGTTTTVKRSQIEVDVPCVPDRIWETKRYTRLDYGTNEEVFNQLLKYQAAIDLGHFAAATLEIHGNIAPGFLRALIDDQPIAPGLHLHIPDVEVLYTVDEHLAVPLRLGRATSLARGSDSVLIRALAFKRYGLFSGRIVTPEDTHDPELVVHTGDGGTIDPLKVTDPHAFRRLEKLIWQKRRALLEAL